jgi:NAD(P)-dependent dehydrogenase (short-subunit alcohol dehydrogenase family)
MQGRFDGRSALATGAANGIGRATALRLASEGARVCLADVDEAGNAATLAQIEAAGGAAITCRCDVTDEASVLAAVTRAEQAHEPLRILSTPPALKVTTATWTRWPWTIESACRP